MCICIYIYIHVYNIIYTHIHIYTWYTMYTPCVDHGTYRPFQTAKAQVLGVNYMDADFLLLSRPAHGGDALNLLDGWTATRVPTASIQNGGKYGNLVGRWEYAATVIDQLVPVGLLKSLRGPLVGGLDHDTNNKDEHRWTRCICNLLIYILAREESQLWFWIWQLTYPFQFWGRWVLITCTLVQPVVKCLWFMLTPWTSSIYLPCIMYPM